MEIIIWCGVGMLVIAGIMYVCNKVLDRAQKELDWLDYNMMWAPESKKKGKQPPSKNKTMMME